jgi:hypothetical protein
MIMKTLIVVIGEPREAPANTNVLLENPHDVCLNLLPQYTTQSCINYSCQRPVQS